MKLVKNSDGSAVQSASFGVINPQSARSLPSNASIGGNPQSKGFTLLELMIVLTIMGILITIAQPNLKYTIVKAREAVLRENLYQMRDAIDQHYADNGKYPDQLADLVSADKPRSYLREIPKDPFTGAVEWITVAPEGDEAGVFDVHSASPLVALDGTPYNTW